MIKPFLRSKEGLYQLVDDGGPLTVPQSLNSTVHYQRIYFRSGRTRIRPAKKVDRKRYE